MSIYMLIYISVISLFAAILTIHDKNAARRRKRRVKERTLLAVSALGGSLIMLLTMLAIRHKTRHAKFMVGIPLIILLQIIIVVFVFNNNLTISHYRVETKKISGQIKLALITDYHACNYGDKQSELIDAIYAEQPDAILLCGDIFDAKRPPDNTIELIEGISAKYPCFYVAGNHEFRSKKADEFKEFLTSRGVKVLEGTSEVLDVSGGKIKISGIDDPDTDIHANPGHLRNKSSS